MRPGILTLALLLFPAAGLADEVDFRDYLRLSEGMTEAEILYRLGPADHETVIGGMDDGYRRVALPAHKRWAYLPPRGHSGWITEITFNCAGRVSALERYPP